ncbi:hypothetical protein JRO89_XS01G0288900 [Xanthoceras sorbifolium]|uniref:Uncharacterized protein n=1 Tax=Xanthoceras sorbifolium TaxID=99658 RepID=A0ABQ8IM03_9ROSI|nr:hypothetical protein JRO89_XS01G0288900 [Xanthoceras sorbifolium]
MSVSYDSLNISKQYHELCKGKSQCFDAKEEIINLKHHWLLALYPIHNSFACGKNSFQESCILEYLTGFLSGQLHQLWKLSPALIAVAIPSCEYLGDGLMDKFSFCKISNAPFQLSASSFACLAIEDGGLMLQMLQLLSRWEAAQRLQGRLLALIVCISNSVSVQLSVDVVSANAFDKAGTERLKRIQFLKWGKKMRSTRSAVTLGSVQRRVPTGCVCKSHVWRQPVWKLKSLWKQALGSQRIKLQYSYDIHSYSLNFDDGLFPR